MPTLRMDLSYPLFDKTERKTVWQAYLLGQGLCKYKKRDQQTHYTRGALTEGKFNVHIRFAPPSADWPQRKNDIASLKSALVLFGCLGGLGSRWRRGLGSIALVDCQKGNIRVPASREEWTGLIKPFLAHGDPYLPPFSALSDLTKIALSPIEAIAPWELLGRVAKELQMERSWGRTRSDGCQIVNGEHSEKNFQFDHDCAEHISHGRRQGSHPKRIVYGLPHAYFFSPKPAKPKSEARMRPSGKGRDRRASPLLIHIHQLPGGECFAVQTQLRACFLPNGDKIIMEQKQGKKWRPVESVPVWEDWSMLDRYFKRSAFSGWDVLP